jgi:fatty-acyl-CoA synthase
VIAVPHDEWGERPAALVTLAPGADLDPDDLRVFLAEQVTGWWLPNAVEVVDTEHANRLARR